MRSARAAGLLVAKIVPKDFIFIFLFFLYFLFCLYLFVCLKFKPFKRILSEILPKESQKSCKAKMFIDVMFCYSLTLPQPQPHTQGVLGLQPGAMLNLWSSHSLCYIFFLIMVSSSVWKTCACTNQIPRHKNTGTSK